MTTNDTQIGFQVASWRILIVPLVLVVLIAHGEALSAQAIKIKLVNGKSGLPIVNTCVNTWVGSERKEAMAIPVDESGIARLRLTNNDSEIDIHNRWKGCGDFGIVNPVVKYDDSMHIHAGYVLCQLRKPNYSWLAITNLSTKQILQHGIATANTCGKVTASPEPGEVIIFV